MNRVLLTTVVVLTCLSSDIAARKVATVYDILALVYRLCAAEEQQRSSGLDCVDYHMGADVSRILEQCMAHHRIKGEEPTTSNDSEVEVIQGHQRVGVQRLCHKLTLVEEWTNKHSRPPNQLTTVIGIEALGRMTCVMGSVQRPLPSWTAAFSKCFTNQETNWSAEKLSGKFPPSSGNM